MKAGEWEGRKGLGEGYAKLGKSRKEDEEEP